MQPEPAIGQIYRWCQSQPNTSLFMVIAVHRKTTVECDWVKVRGCPNYTGIGTYIDHERVDNAKLYEGELTDAEHALCMSILLDVEGYIREQKA